MTCFCATEAILETPELESSDAVYAIALFDNEEVGSESNQGAESNMITGLVHRLAALDGDHAAARAEQSFARSFLVSSDTAHAVHPNYAGVHEDNLRPKMNAGPVIKTNAKQRYASTAATTFLLRRIAQLAGVPLQEFEVRNDCPCGSTIGPMLSKVRTRSVRHPLTRSLCAPWTWATRS